MSLMLVRTIIRSVAPWAGCWPVPAVLAKAASAFCSAAIAFLAIRRGLKGYTVTWQNMRRGYVLWRR
ncbi:hypothetical protein KPSA1_03475 [Pseudomonas syringae pv. actinidiae]|uniref:Uncharacterized protein n=1 Tax=Pseudomonas syringae pv. actinidiae TaxID=103796 RepID=A0A2V0QAN4_PSESF|nr:hypothetical protein KPSA1_03475 [Pseudomonas syringae pv. actinidiae]